MWRFTYIMTFGILSWGYRTKVSITADCDVSLSEDSLYVLDAEGWLYEILDGIKHIPAEWQVLNSVKDFSRQILFLFFDLENNFFFVLDFFPLTANSIEDKGRLLNAQKYSETLLFVLFCLNCNDYCINCDILNEINYNYFKSELYTDYKLTCIFETSSKSIQRS